MGMFDTIIPEVPLACPYCGHKITEIQTKALSNLLDTYRCGMILPHSPIITGILRESYWCHKCRNHDQEKDTDVFIVIWHTILVGVVSTEQEAEKLFQSVDRVNLIAWLDQMQKQAHKWKKMYYNLRNDLSHWHKYTTEQNDQKNSILSIFWRPHEDILNAKDPLDEILTRIP